MKILAVILVLAVGMVYAQTVEEKAPVRIECGETFCQISRTDLTTLIRYNSQMAQVIEKQTEELKRCKLRHSASR